MGGLSRSLRVPFPNYSLQNFSEHFALLTFENYISIQSLFLFMTKIYMYVGVTSFQKYVMDQKINGFSLRHFCL